MNRKKIPYIFAFLGIALTAGVAFAQPTLVDPIEVFEGSLDNPDTEEIALHWDVTNLTNDTMHLMVTRSIVQLVSPYNLPYDEDNSGAYDRFCWGPLCYPYGTNSSFTTDAYLVHLPPNETDSTFIVDYYPAGVAGVTALDYCFHPVDDIDAGTCQQVLFCLDAANCALNIDEIRIESSPVFPQPVRGISSFPYHLNGASMATLRIHNASGQLMEQETLSAQHGIVYLDAAEYAPGMYILTVATPDGAKVSERFIVQ